MSERTGDSHEPILRLRGLCKHFPIFSKSLIRRKVALVRAVDEVTLDVLPGRTLAIVGESGCGKTTLARTMLRALTPTAGQILFRSNGRYVDLAALPPRALKPLRPRMQMIFQDPFSSLNPRMTIGQIVGEPLVIHRLASAADRRRRVVRMLERVGLDGEHVDRYPHEFSGGQRQRIGIARALIMEPSLVVCDEPVSALDVSVQAQVVNLLAELQDELRLTYVFIAHDLSVVRHISHHVAVMYAGRVVESAPTAELFGQPRHPYTQALLASVPSPDPDVRMAAPPPGEVADPANLPVGCAFAPRCPKRIDLCTQRRPDLICVQTNHDVACHLHHPLPVLPTEYAPSASTDMAR
jgi:oligopeptide/dipeptide ABC transporter ATP-binding protein